ncbi:MAG: flagellar biosynthesis protein FlhB [Bdellovibrionales bacterium]
MAEEDQDQKTEAPTGKRLSEAREKGQLPVSRETTAWVLFLGVLISVAWLVPMTAERLVPTLRVFLEMPHAISLDGHGLQVVMTKTIVQIGLATVLIFALLAAMAILGTMLQTGFFASAESIQPNIERLSPMAGLKRIFSTVALVELGKSFAKLVVIGAVVFFVLKPVISELPGFDGHDMIHVLMFLHKESVHLIIWILVVFAFIAVIDLLYQRHTYFKGLRMTKAEVKDEFKQQEGDPMIKSRLRQIRLEKARKRMMAQVPKADVVLTNPTHYAVALQYDGAKMAAPVVLAKGIDRVAERIREVALENKIPLVSNPPLTRALYDTVDIDEAIPTQHYRAVAEIISYVYRLKKRKF